MTINDLTPEIRERFFKCINEGIGILDKYLPEIRIHYGNAFEIRVVQTLYLELIHAGFFNGKSS